LWRFRFISDRESVFIAREKFSGRRAGSFRLSSQRKPSGISTL